MREVQGRSVEGVEQGVVGQVGVIRRVEVGIPLHL